MKYSKEKSEKLVKEFKYLIGMSYHPFGKKGREFEIKELISELPNLRINRSKLYVESEKNPNYEKEKNEEHKNGKNWSVKVKITESKDELIEDLETVLKVLKIRHDIDKLFN